MLPLYAAPPKPTREPYVRVVDLNVGESAEVDMCDSGKARVKLLDLQETRDPFRDAVREARVKVEINGKEATLIAGNYNRAMLVVG